MDDRVGMREGRELGGDTSLKEVPFELSLEDKGKNKQGVFWAGGKSMSWTLEPLLFSLNHGSSTFYL